MAPPKSANGQGVPRDNQRQTQPISYGITAISLAESLPPCFLGVAFVLLRLTNPLRQVRGDVVMQHGSGMYMDDIWKGADCRGDWRKAMEQLAEHWTNLFGSPITLQVDPSRCALY